MMFWARRVLLAKAKIGLSTLQGGPKSMAAGGREGFQHLCARGVVAVCQLEKHEHATVVEHVFLIAMESQTSHHPWLPITRIGMSPDSPWQLVIRCPCN